MVEESKNYLADLVDYIKKNLKKGYTKESMRWALVNQGYSKMEVDKALRMVDHELAQQAPILKTPPTIKYEVIEPKDEEVKKPFWKRMFGL